MRAKHLLMRSFEFDRGAVRGGRPPRNAGCGLRFRALMIVAAALALLAFFVPTAIVLSLTVLYSISLTRVAKLPPGISSVLLVPG